jgi:hypothetical protein
MELVFYNTHLYRLLTSAPEGEQMLTDFTLIQVCEQIIVVCIAINSQLDFRGITLSHWNNCQAQSDLLFVSC